MPIALLAIFVSSFSDLGVEISQGPLIPDWVKKHADVSVLNLIFHIVRMELDFLRGLIIRILGKIASS